MLDPKTFELVSAGDHHLPFVVSSSLTSAAIRSRFANPPSWSPEVSSDRLRPPGSVLTPAAVLVPLVEHASGEIEVLLTRRTEKLKKHAGQIAFPGGKLDASDANAVAGALRETYEEVGIQAEHIEVLGQLPLYETGTGFQVLPVVGLLQAGRFTTQINEDEVAAAFTVPLAFLMDPANHQRRSFIWENGRREFFAMPYEEHFVWGATASMLRNLYRFLSA